MIADGYDSKPENIFHYSLPHNKQIRLLNTALIFGSNGSGKSNIMRGLFELLSLLKTPSLAGSSIKYYDPFKFNSDSEQAPIEFQIRFLDKEKVPYLYTVAFIKTEIVKEELYYWPNGRETLAFERKTDIDEEGIHNLIIGKTAQEGRESEKIYKNNFGISHFSSLTPNKVILSAFNALQQMRIVNTLNDRHRNGNRHKLGELISSDENFRKKINSLVRYADLNINEIKVEEANNNLDLEIDPDIEDDSDIEVKEYKLYATHQYYDGKKETPTEKNNPLADESQGSRTILGLGTEIIIILEKGGVLFVDEFETSLHPLLTKALLKIFQSEKLNPKKAQLIFTTHDTNLMDQTVFRRDQIWFTTKNSRGESSLFSMVDFSELREGHAFEKWYLSGKFGALPELDSIEKAFG